MTGRSIPALRAAYDLTFAVASKPPAKPARKRARAVADLRAYVRRPKLAERVLMALYAAKVPLHLHDIGGQPGVNKVSELRKQYGAGIIGSRRGIGYWLTVEGRALVERLYPA